MGSCFIENTNWRSLFLNTFCCKFFLTPVSCWFGYAIVFSISILVIFPSSASSPSWCLCVGLSSSQASWVHKPANSDKYPSSRSLKKLNNRLEIRVGESRLHKDLIDLEKVYFLT